MNTPTASAPIARVLRWGVWLLALSGLAVAGPTLAAKPAQAPLLGSHASTDAQKARRELLKQRQTSLQVTQRPSAKAAKTVGAGAHAPGKTIVGRSKTSS